MLPLSIWFFSCLFIFHTLTIQWRWIIQHDPLLLESPRWQTSTERPGLYKCGWLDDIPWPAMRLRPNVCFKYNYTYIYLFILWAYLQHREVPRLGFESELPGASLHHSHSNARSEPCLYLHHSSWQHQILNPLSTARDKTCIFMGTSWVLNLLSHNRNSQLHIF